MIKKILFADDLHPRAMTALKVAVDLARKYDAELTILNVQDKFLDKDEMVMLRVDVSDFQDDMKKTALTIRSKIEEDIHTCSGMEITSEILIREGKPHDEILKVARELNVDLIVLGSHGRHSLKDKLFGTTSEAVIRQANRSVLAVWTGE